VIDVTCESDREAVCKKYYLYNGIWYASSNISRNLKRSLEKREDLPDFEDLPEDFKNFVEDMMEESKSERALSRKRLTYKKMKEINELGKEKLELETP